MNETPVQVEKQIEISEEAAARLAAIAQQRHVSEGYLVEQALTALFQLIALEEPSETTQDWASLSEASLRRVWDNDEDAIYDNWRELYGVPEG
ncbi:MAG: hypothetical protein M3Z04_08765 [Chloroflexota bacterium]|nr:hypothetical protein [Chloroflexota bacterium]